MHNYNHLLFNLHDNPEWKSFLGTYDTKGNLGSEKLDELPKVIEWHNIFKPTRHDTKPMYSTAPKYYHLEIWGVSEQEQIVSISKSNGTNSYFLTEVKVTN